MQKRKDVSARGLGTLFKSEAIRFVLNWPHKINVPKDWIDAINTYAGSPEILRHTFRVNFAIDYAAAPDLAAALLNHLRKKWRNLDKTKSGKLKNFLARNAAVKWERGFGGKPDSLGWIPTWDLQDGEIARAFEHSPGGIPVKIEDVTKARKWAKRNQDAGNKLAKKVFDENGYLHAKGKPRRRK